MDTLTFIESIIKSLSWPIFLILAIILLRGSIDEIILAIKNKLGLLKGAKYKDLELLFEDVNKIAENTKKIKAIDFKDEKEKIITALDFYIMLNTIKIGFLGASISSKLLMQSIGKISKKHWEIIYNALTDVLEGSFDIVQKNESDTELIKRYRESLKSHKELYIS